MSRSIKIRMQKSATDLPKLDLASLDEFVLLQDEISRWAFYARLDPNPDMSGYVGRAADPWRVLFAIAADLGKTAEIKRAAKVLLPVKDGQHAAETVIRDLKMIFRENNKTGANGFWKSTLVEMLREIGDGHWSEIAASITISRRASSRCTSLPTCSTRSRSRRRTTFARRARMAPLAAGTQKISNRFGRGIVQTNHQRRCCASREGRQAMTISPSGGHVRCSLRPDMPIQTRWARSSYAQGCRTRLVTLSARILTPDA